MAKSDYIPHTDNDLLIWHDCFKNNLVARQADLGLSAEDLAMVDVNNSNLHAKITAANASAAAARHATAEKNACRNNAENHVRALTRRIKAHPAYTEAIGNLLGVIGAENTVDLSSLKPLLNGTDQTDGVVLLKYLKSKSDGVNIYCQRENDAGFVFLARNSAPSYLDSRPLLVAGKPELRRYTAVYVLNDTEIGHFSDELVVSCAP
jgi:hypothetical protein